MRFRTITLMLAIGLLLAACSSSAATPTAATPTSPPPTNPAIASVVSSAFHLEKTCSADFSCKVTKSSYAGIPVGTMISYSGPNQGSLSAVVTVSDGTATGQCDIGSLPGKCAFSGGTGSLAGFKLDIVVTQSVDGLLWMWDSSTAP